MKTLYVEISLCRDTGSAGWGATLEDDGAVFSMSGTMPAPPQGGGSTAIELGAVDAAIGRLEASGRLKANDELEVAMRSTAALSVLRWVFPNAPVVATMEIHTPKKLSPVTRDLPAIYDLSDAVERMGVTVSLRHASGCASASMAHAAARGAMDTARGRAPA